MILNTGRRMKLRMSVVVVIAAAAAAAAAAAPAVYHNLKPGHT